MVESMIGPDTMKKMMVKTMGVVFGMLAFMGMILVVITSINPTFHAHLWPVLLSVGCSGTWLTAKGKGTKINLAGIAFLAGLWILLNSIMGWVEPAAGSAGAEFMTPVMLALSATGALLVVFGSLIGILGAMKS